MKQSRFPRVSLALVFGVSGLLSSVSMPVAVAQDSSTEAVAKQPPAAEPVVHSLISRIAFGSCQTQDEPLPILRTVLEWEPELFIYLGDNIYGDTNDMRVLEAKYARMGAKKEFRALRAAVPTIATWDDHDYGANDAGKDYPFKQQSKDIFLKFWNEPDPSPRREHDGIYTSYRFEDKTAGKTLQVILLDTRTFRDPPLESPLTSWKNDYLPDTDPTKTILGEGQWKWLEERLKEPADLRIIGSSIQFSHEYNGWESWTNFPRELLKMVDLIRATKANGVVFISGDVHWGELSALKPPGCYPLYDLTASGLNRDWENVEPNRNRIGEACSDFHFGMVDINWSSNPTVTFRIHDSTGRARVRKSVRIGELQFAN